MENVVYTKSNWEDSPSTNTPFYADRLNNMDKGVDDCKTRANGSVPYDNILDTEDAEAVTERDTYLHDAIDMKDVANRIGENTIVGKNNDYTIFHFGIGTIPLGSYTLVKIKDITPTVSSGSVVESSIEFDISSVENHDKMCRDDFFVKTRSVSYVVSASYSDYYFCTTYVPYVLYNPSTGKGSVENLVDFNSDSYSYAKHNVSIYYKTL